MSVARQSPIERGDGAQRVGWLELFYDLVFVATIVTFSDAVTDDPELDVIIVAIAAFAAVWWIWLVTSLLANRFPVDDGLQRVLVLVQMLLLLLIALNVGDGIEHHEGFVSFAYAVLCADVAVMHARHARAPGIAGEIAARRRNEFAIGAVLFVIAGFVPGVARYVLWGIGLAVVVVPALVTANGRGRQQDPLDEHHLVERLGLLTIIVCGEAFVKVALISAHGNLGSVDYIVMSALFVLIFAMWWSYFDDIPDAGLSRAVVPLMLWFVTHLLFQVGVVGIAVGYGELVRLDNGTDMDGDRTLLTVGPIVLALVALAVLGASTRRRPIGPLAAVRVGAAVLAAVVGVTVAELGWVDVEPASVLFAVVVLAQAAACDRLRRGTRVLPP